MKAIGYLQRIVKDNFFIIDKGRDQEEKSVIMVEQGQMRGYGYMPHGTVINQVDELKEVIKPMPGSRDAQRIIHWYVKEQKMEKVVPFEI